MNLDKFNSLSRKAQEQLKAAGLHYENASGEILKKKAKIDNDKMWAAGVKKFHLPPEYAKAYLKTIYEANWAHTAKQKFVVALTPFVSVAVGKTPDVLCCATAVPLGVAALERQPGEEQPRRVVVEDAVRGLGERHERRAACMRGVRDVEPDELPVG